MFSLYIHIPFCRSKCRYCDFYSTVYSGQLADTFIDALKLEWERVRDRLKIDKPSVPTIYIGGGTPSTLNMGQWARIMQWIRRHFNLSADTEFTVECNPESFSEDIACLWLDNGVNRVSAGIQSLDDRILRFLGRPHDSLKALEMLENPAIHRFRSVSVDCIFGIPGQTPESLNATLDKLLSNPHVKHLSAYELTIHDSTPFGRHRRLLGDVSNDVVADMMTIVSTVSERHGFSQYEISNFARDGHACRHNIGYWAYRPYIGLGPSAHSFIPPVRESNVPDTQEYINKLKTGDTCVSMREELNKEQIKEELLFLGLRNIDGIDEKIFPELTGEPFYGLNRIQIIDGLSEKGFLVHENGRWKPTVAGMRIADAIARNLL